VYIRVNLEHGAPWPSSYILAALNSAAAYQQLPDLFEGASRTNLRVAGSGPSATTGFIVLHVSSWALHGVAYQEKPGELGYHSKGKRNNMKSEPQVRRYRRSLYSVPITIYNLAPTVQRTSQGISLDISEGGVGALISGDPKIGDRVRVELQLREHLLTADAVLRYTSRTRSGFEFLKLSPEQRSHIARAVANR
jgi:hypothetical protein